MKCVKYDIFEMRLGWRWLAGHKQILIPNWNTKRRLRKLPQRAKNIRMESSVHMVPILDRGISPTGHFPPDAFC